MDKRLFLLLASLLVATSALAQAYRWVDDQGVVHYSDRPEPGAESIVLPRSNTTSVRRPARPASGADDAAAADPAQPFRYESIEITSPTAEETLWNIGGVLNVSIAVTPALQPGHQVRMYFDGVATMVSGTGFQIEEVHRGTHNLQVEILDANGELMIRTRANRFYVQQNTVAF